MQSPYRIDPEAIQARRTEEEKLITLKDEATKPSPTIGVPGWQGILAGPLMGQPSSRFQTFEHERPKASLATRLLLGILVLFFAYLFYKQF